MQSYIERLKGGDSLSREEMTSVIDTFMRGEGSDADIGDFLFALQAKGETVDEIAGAATSLRKHMRTIHSRHERLVDTCGTGGDGSGTFNISTAAALVTAAAGLPVAKHGNRGITSRTGSADVLAALGVNIEVDVPVVERCLDELGICFCFAPLMHPAMRHVSVARKQLGVPTIFNLLGPLCNPASAPIQLLGVGKPQLRGRLAAALQMLGCLQAAVVCGEDGLDEVTTAAATRVCRVTPESLSDEVWQPETFGVPSGELTALAVEGPEGSAAMIREVLAGQSGPHRNIVVLNAAAALWVAGEEDSPIACRQRAERAIDRSDARNLLTQWAEFTNRESV